MKKNLAFLIILLTGLMGFNASAIRSFTLTLSPGSSAVIKEYVAGEFIFKQALKEGDNPMEVDDYKSIYVFPAPGIEEISITPEDGNVFRDRKNPQMYTITGNSGLNDKTYTVTTSGGSVAKPSTHIHLAQGAQAYVLELNERTFEYTVHAELQDGDNLVEFETDSKAIPGTVPFYYLCGREGFILDKVTDAKGAAVELKENSELGTYIELTAYTYLPEYHVTTKDKPIPEGDPTFVLSAGSRAVYVPFGGGNRRNLTPGDNYVTINENDQYMVFPADGFHFVSFTDKNGNKMPITDSGYALIAGFNLMAPYYITTEKNENPDPTFTIDIDEPEKVECYYASSGKTISLRKGLNTLSFNEYGEKRVWMQISGLNPKPFYSFKVNGVERPSSDNQPLDLTDGMEIVARVNFPEDLKFTYNLEYNGESEGFWTSVKVDDEEVEVVDGKFEAPAGSFVELYNSTAGEWLINEIKTPASRYTSMTSSKPISFFAISDGTISVNARPVKRFDITINLISGYESVKVVMGAFTTGRELVGLKKGENKVTIKENDDINISHLAIGGVVNSITYKPSPDAELKQANYNVYWRYYYASNLSEGAVINIDVEEIEYTNSCTFYVDDATGIYMSTDNNRTIMLKNGYNTVIFNDSENGEKGVTLRGATDATIFCNNQQIRNSGNITLENGKIYKLYNAIDNPSLLTVTFDIQEGYTLVDPTVDINTPVNTGEKTISVLPGTQLSFAVSTAAGIEKYIAANGVEITPDSNGRYVIDIDGETTVSLGRNNDAITDITTDSDNGQAVYYDLTGRRIDSDRLTPGIYIMVKGGKATKIAVK